MSPITEFNLSLCRLLDQFPLYQYRTPALDRNGYVLPVLLIGYGKRMETILRTMLTQGQLLDTALDITLVSTNAKGNAASLLHSAPSLPLFADILPKFSDLTSPADGASLASLHFEQVPEPMSAAYMENVMDYFGDASYIVISTGDDALNADLANACVSHGVDHKTLITYIQNRGVDDTKEISPLLQVHTLRSEKAPDYRQELEQIAFNMHYTYMKQQNSRAAYQTIADSFRDEYAYLSNMEAALHVRTKLACCGILDKDAAVAAQKFDQLMRKQPEMIERLSVLEHQRWTMSKVLSGYSPMKDINQIYTNGAGTHDSVQKWHCCLVPCDPAGKSHLTPEDWDRPTIREDLDPLDRITLQVHAQCKKLAVKAKEPINTFLSQIKKTITDNPCFSAAAVTAWEELDVNLSQLWQYKQRAIAPYLVSIDKLSQIIAEEGGALAGLFSTSLNQLKEATRPLLEYVSKKDYKLQDRILIEQIPFAMTHKPLPRLMKVLSGNRKENLMSFWTLEPKELIFVGAAGSLAQLRQMRHQAKEDCSFISTAAPGLTPSYWICVPDTLPAQAETNSMLKDWNCSLLPISNWTIASMAEALSPVSTAWKADYLDITGGNPLVSRALEQITVSSGTTSFYTENGRCLSLSGAEALSYPAPQKDITVKEMFDLSGAVAENNSSMSYASLSKKSETLWEIQQRGKNYWGPFCEEILRAYERSPKAIGSYVFQPTENMAVSDHIYQFSSVSPAAAMALSPSLQELQKNGYLYGLKLQKEASSNIFDDFYKVSFRSKSTLVNHDAFRSYIKNCFDHYQPGFSFRYKPNLHGGRLECFEPQVQGMPLSGSVGTYVNPYGHTLQALADCGLLQSYNANRRENIASFRLATPELLSIFEKAGNILEYYLYYTCMYQAHFTDIEMGYEFLHSDDSNAARNEIDLICTKGNSSMFISCKLRSKDTISAELNYIIYEISLLAEKFGLNPKICLAAPAVPQFEHAGNHEKILSHAVKKALGRGVYLLGDACFSSSSNLGKVLDRIMEGSDHWCDFL